MQPLVPRKSEDQVFFSNLRLRRRILILGSTGSIGKSALELVEKFPENFELVGIVALGSNPEVFAQQIQKFSPKFAAVIKKESHAEVERLSGKKVLCGQDQVIELCKSSDVDVVLTAVVGAAGLSTVIASLESGKMVALANKESLVVGGELVRQLCRQYGTLILPVDSEHSALFQCLMGVRDEEISSLTLTASGGPFLRKKLSELSEVTPKEATHHPRWQMGPKISVDSATLINKALELIEAHYLYAVPASKLSAVIHPQSIVHAIVNLKDGSSIMQAAVPDMKAPIAFALNYPQPRLPGIIPELDYNKVKSLDFEEIDHDRFPAIKIALSCIEQGSAASLVLNEANEYAVARFLEGQLKFVSILPFIQEILSKNFCTKINNLEDIFELQSQVVGFCSSVVKQYASFR